MLLTYLHFRILKISHWTNLGISCSDIMMNDDPIWMSCTMISGDIIGLMASVRLWNDRNCGGRSLRWLKMLISPLLKPFLRTSQRPHNRWWRRPFWRQPHHKLYIPKLSFRNKRSSPKPYSGLSGCHRFQQPTSPSWPFHSKLSFNGTFLSFTGVCGRQRSPIFSAPSVISHPLSPIDTQAKSHSTTD